MNKAIGLFGGVAAAVAVFGFGFLWFCCRVYVPEGQMAIVTAKTGRPLPPGRILAEPGEKGVQRVPLAEGRHFLNPINNDWRIVPTMTIPAGSVGVVTSKTGKELAAGDLLVFGDMAIYTTCKNNTFNGMPLPDIYRLRPDGAFERLTEFGYKDFKNRLGKN